MECSPGLSRLSRAKITSLALLALLVTSSAQLPACPSHCCSPHSAPLKVEFGKEGMIRVCGPNQRDPFVIHVLSGDRAWTPRQLDGEECLWLRPGLRNDWVLSAAAMACVTVIGTSVN